MAKEKFIIEPHFRLQEWVAEEKGYFQDEGLDYVFRELIQSTDGKHHYKGDKVGAMQSFETRPRSECELRLSLDRRRCSLEGQGPALCRCLFGVAVRRLRADGLAHQEARGSGRRADLGRLPIRQPLFDDPGARAVHAGRQDQSTFADGMLFNRLDLLLDGKAPAIVVVIWPVLFRGAAWLSEDHRFDLHDRDHDHGRSRSGRRAQILPRAAPRATRH